MSDKVPVFEVFAVLWSKKCSENNNIYYKTPEQLRTHFNILEDRKKYRECVKMSFDVTREVYRVAQNQVPFFKSAPATPDHRSFPHIYFQEIQQPYNLLGRKRPIALAQLPPPLPLIPLESRWYLDQNGAAIEQEQIKWPRVERTCLLCENNKCPG